MANSTSFCCKMVANRFLRWSDLTLSLSLYHSISFYMGSSVIYWTQHVPEAIFRKYPLLGEKTSWNKCYWLTEFRNDMGYLSFSIQLTTIMKIPTPGYQMSHDIFINIFTRSSLPRLKSRPYSPERFKSAQLWSNVMLGIRITLLLSQS